MEFSTNEANSMPSKGAIRKGKRTMDQAVASGKLSPEDIAYIKVATDPWHDTSIHNFVGIPDGYTGKSITEVFTETIEIKSPYPAGSGNWGCRIYNNPLLGAARLIKTAINGPTANQENLNATVRNYMIMSTGQVDYSLSSSFDDYPVQQQNISLPQEVLDGDVKIAGLGIEVVNTTSDLYKQGMATICRFPQMGSASIIPMRIYGNDPATASTYKNSNSNLIPVTSVPTTLSELTTYPNYCQWEAREGAYAVVRQYNPGSHAPTGFCGALRNVNFTPNATSDFNTKWGPVVFDTTWLEWMGVGQTGMPEPCFLQRNGFISAPMDTVCMMFTGLSESTTMTLRFKFYIERRVNSSIPALKSLVPLAKDSPPYNPVAAELVSQLLTALPAAVMFKENPAGEWWDRVLGAIGEYGPQLLGMIPHPVAQMAAKALPHATNALRGKTEESEEEKLRKEIARLKTLMEQRGVLERKALQAAKPRTMVVKAAPKPSNNRKSLSGKAQNSKSNSGQFSGR